jgi:hypothetical protein
MNDIREIALEAEKLDNDEHCSGVTIIPIRKLHEWADALDLVAAERAGDQQRLFHYETEIGRLCAERAELLAALRFYAGKQFPDGIVARTAIAKAEGGK